jgi:hypothetical protein
MCAFQRLINSSPPLAGHDQIGYRDPTTGQTSRFRQSGTGVSGPYRRAISAGEAICDGSVRSFAAGSALVPPTAARIDAAAGSTWWRHSRHPAKPCGSPKGRHHTIRRRWAWTRSVQTRCYRAVASRGSCSVPLYVKSQAFRYFWSTAPVFAFVGYKIASRMRTGRLCPTTGAKPGQQGGSQLCGRRFISPRR